MHISYTIKKSDIFAWNQHVAATRQRKNIIKVCLVIVCSLVAMSVFLSMMIVYLPYGRMIYIGSIMTVAMLMGVSIVNLAYSYDPVGVRKAIWRGRYRDVLGPHMLMQTSQELVHVSERGEDRIPIWMIQRVLETPDLYIVVLDSGKELWIVKRAFATHAQRERFVYWLFVATRRHGQDGGAVPAPPSVAQLASVTAYKNGVPWYGSKYKLLREQLRRAWQDVQASSAGSYGEPPARWYIQQHAACSDDLAYCMGSVERLWLYDGSLLLALPGGLPFTVDQNERGGYWADGVLRLHICPDGRHVVWNLHMGRKHARGHALRVVGKGNRAALEVDTDYGSWVA